MLAGLQAVNPDKNPGESLIWIYISPSSGGNICFKLIMNEDKTIATIEDFSYNPPQDFNGIDTFTILADEGDRLTTLEVEVHVKAGSRPSHFFRSWSPEFVCFAKFIC